MSFPEGAVAVLARELGGIDIASRRGADHAVCGRRMRSRVSLVWLLVVGVMAFVLGACGGAVGGGPTPYPVGFTTRSVTYTLPDSTQRTVVIDIWYPAREAQPTPTQSPSNAVPDSPSHNDATHPLVIFSHGVGGTPSDYSVFLSHLASHGYVVAAPEHQDCRGSCSFSDYSSEIVRRPLDVRSAVDSVLSLDISNDAILKNMVDPQRVGVAGQSFGGWTALEAQQTDSRFRAVLVMNAATVQSPPADPTKVSRPLLMMTGELDALVPFALTEDFYSRVPPAQDRFLLVVPRAGHEFMDQCFDAALTLLPCATALPQDQLVGIMNGIGTAFLDRYVAGEPASASGLLLDATNSPNYTLVPTRASASPQPLPTAAPAPSGPTPSAAGTANQPGTVLLKDDLANAQDGKLPTTSTDPARYSAAYADGSYDIAVNRSFDQGESVLPGTYADATLSVDAVLVHPEDDQYVQLACRSQNATSQYRFGFRPTTGEVWINRWFAGAGIQRYTPLSDDMSRAIRRGSESNYVELTCKGTTIEARINGAIVASVSDNTFQAGQFWIAVGESPGGTSAAVTTEAHFSNLAITQE